MKRIKTGWIIAGVIIVVILIIALNFSGKYNMLVTTNENIDGKWSQVENNL